MIPYSISQQPSQRAQPATILVKRIAANLTSTANANVAWVNPEGGTVVATVRYFVTGLAGTGSLWIGVSNDGTGSASGIFASGTLTAGVHIRPDPASATAGVIATQTVLLGPGGTGTSNSIVAQLDDTATSTMGTLIVEIEYRPIAPL